MKRISKRLSRAFGSSHNDKQVICKYQGVAVAWLDQFAKEIQRGVQAPGVELVLFKDKYEGVWVGATGKVISRTESTVTVDVPYIGTYEVPVGILESKPRDDWDTEDVCEYVVKGHEAMMKQKQFYIDTMNPQHVGKQFKGAFVSQARRTKFKELTAAIVSYYEGKSIDLSQAFVWMDLFGANQPLLCDPNASKEIQKQRNELLGSGLHEALAKFDDLLAFFDNWRNPKLLQRAWCVWELYGAARFRVPVADTQTSFEVLQVIFTPEEHERFVDDGLINDYDSIQSSIATMQVEKAECFNAEDKKMIDENIRTNVTGGHNKLDEMVADQMQKWLTSAAQGAIRERRAKPKTPLDFADLLNNTGALLDDQGKLELALEAYLECLDIYKAELGPTDTAVARTLNGIACVYEKQDKLELALETHEEALAIKMAKLEPTDPIIANTLNNMANIYEKQGKLELALETHIKCLAMKKAKLEPTNVKITNTLSNMANVYLKQGKTELALETFSECLQAEKVSLGPTHPNVALTLNGMASVYLSQSKLEEALDTYSQCLDIQKANLGPTHHLVASTLQNMALAMHKKESFKEAANFEREVLAIRVECFGKEHPKTKEAVAFLAHLESRS